MRRPISQSGADMTGCGLLVLIMLAAVLFVFLMLGCSVPRQPAGYVPDDVRHCVIVTAGQGLSVERDDSYLTLPPYNKAEPSTLDASGIILFDGTGINDQYQYTLEADVTTNVGCQHMCTHLCYPSHSNPPGSTCCMCFQKIPLPPPCDHFYVKQAIPIDSPLAGFDLDWMPCKCIHCNDLTICK